VFGRLNEVEAVGSNVRAGSTAPELARSREGHFMVDLGLPKEKTREGVVLYVDGGASESPTRFQTLRQQEN
jgi:hypothetical protein